MSVPVGAIEHNSGWLCEAYLNTGASGGGYILNNVRHGLFPFARDVRIVRMSAAASDPYQSKTSVQTFVPGGPEFSVLTGNEEPQPQPDKLIEPYYPVLHLSAPFETNTPVLSDADCRLKLWQDYIFTAYNNQPAHEPSGQLKAARFYPLLRFQFSPATRNHPMYFRADYRIELNLSEHRSTLSRNTDSLMQAGVFQDKDVPRGFSAIGGVFARGEKPLRYELIGEGLRKGLEHPVSQDGDWDNIHLWPLDPIMPGDSPEHLPYVLPSTPGAFHAAHTHWRWSLALGLTSGRQYRGVGTTTIGRKITADVSGAPLIDPHNANQRLRFAITKAERWGREENWIRQPLDFDQLIQMPPERIDGGANLAMLISIEVFRDLELQPLRKGWTGALYVNGFFFAHEEEPYAIDSSRRKSLIRPGSKVEQKWNRVP